TLTGHHANQINSLAFASDGEAMVSSDWSDQTFRWSLTTGAAKRVCRPSSWLHPLAVARDGTVARYTAGSRTLRLFAPNGSVRSGEFSRGWIRGLAFSPSGGRLILLGQPTWLLDTTREDLQPEEVALEGDFVQGAFLDERRCVFISFNTCILYDLDAH